MDGDGLLGCCGFRRRDDAANVNFGALGQLIEEGVGVADQIVFNTCVGLPTADGLPQRFLCLMAGFDCISSPIRSSEEDVKIVAAVVLIEIVVEL